MQVAIPQLNQHPHSLMIVATNVVAAQREVSSPLCDLQVHTNFITAVKDEPSEDGARRRKKRNRWGDATENKAAGLMGLPTAIMANMTSEQLEAYTLHLRIEEISQKLKIDDVVPADGDRYVYAPLSPTFRF